MSKISKVFSSFYLFVFVYKVVFVCILLKPCRREMSLSIVLGLLFVSVCIFVLFLASPDALEVIVVTYSLTDLLSVSTDLTDVTLVSDDTY